MRLGVKLFQLDKPLLLVVYYRPMEKLRRLDNIQLVSFDIWSTLLKANPEYKLERARVLMVSLAIKDLDLEEVSRLIKMIDDHCDELTEQTGEQFGLKERVKKIYEALPVGKKASTLTEEMILGFDEAALEVLLTNLPKIIETDLLKTLAKIESRGIKMALVSNTGFIDGRHMRIVLEKLGILPFMSLQIFSNEVGAAKPNKLIFQALIEKSGVEAKFILHVGDNRKADYDGAVEAGLRAFHLNHSFNSLKELLD